MSWSDEHIFFLDERPIEILTPTERKIRFEKEIGPDIPNLTEAEIETLKKAYMLND